MECGESRAFYLRHLLPQTLYHKYYWFISYLFDYESDYRYIHYRIDSIWKKEEQWAEIASYTKATFHKIFTPAQIEILLNNMQELTGDENYIAVETSINRHLKSDDLLHFGWNVSKRLLSGTQKKLGVTTALFLKKSFPMTLSGYDIGNIPSKLRVENFKVLPLINPPEPLVPYVFPDTENLPALP